MPLWDADLVVVSLQASIMELPLLAFFEQGCHATLGRRPNSRFPTSIHHGASPIADRCLDGNVGCLEACAIEFPPLLPRW